MYKNFLIPNLIIASLSFTLELMFVILSIIINSGWEGPNIAYVGGFIAIWSISVLYGILTQFIGVTHYKADSNIISAGFGMQIPLLQVITIYFTYKFWKNKK